MSDIKHTAIGEETRYLLPREIKIEPKYEARPFSSHSEDEDEKVEALAQTIDQLGQLDACLITPDNVLVAGNRRRRAVILLNQIRTKNGQSLLKLRCTVDASGGDMRRKAILSNLQRADNSKMDLAMLIGGLRRDGLTGSAGTKRIASYLGVSISTVTQAERLLSVEKELQHKVHSGELSMQSTYDLLREIGSPGERTAVLQRAREIQEENRTDDALDAYLGGHRSQEWATQALAPKSRIEHPSITAAIEEHRGSRNGFHCAHKPSRTDLLNEFEAYRHPPYRPEVCAFIDYLIGEYAAGKGTSRDFKAKFESMIRQ